MTGASGWVGFAFAHGWVARHGLNTIQLILPPTPQNSQEAYRAESLRQQGFSILHHDLLQPELSIERLQPFDVLVHCAAYTRTEKITPAVHVNDQGTQHLLTALGAKLQHGRVIYFGSIASFDLFTPPSTGLDEQQPCKPLTPYGQTKLQGEKFVTQLAERYEYAWTILRLPTLYGPGYRSGGLFDIIKCNLTGLHPLTLINWPGSLSLLYIADLTALLMRICDEKVGLNSVLHLGDPTPVRFTSLFEKPARWSLPGLLRRLIMAASLAFIRNFKRPHVAFISAWRLCHLLGNSMVFDTRLAQRLLPMEYTRLEEGLRQTYMKKEANPK